MRPKTTYVKSYDGQKAKSMYFFIEDYDLLFRA